jgi:hypothetical protein
MNAPVDALGERGVEYMDMPAMGARVCLTQGTLHDSNTRTC